MTQKLFLNTAEASAILHRAPQTLRSWASTGLGPISPIKLNKTRGPLLWSISEIEELIGEKLEVCQ